MPKAEQIRLWLTFGIAVAGILAVLVAFIFAIEKFGHTDNPAEIITAVLGPVTGVVGTLAGYVAGQAAGSAGKERAEERAAETVSRAQDKVNAVLDVAPEETLARAQSKHPKAFF